MNVKMEKETQTVTDDSCCCWNLWVDNKVKEICQVIVSSNSSYVAMRYINFDDCAPQMPNVFIYLT